MVSGAQPWNEIEMTVISQHHRTDAPGATRDDGIRKRDPLSAPIQVPKSLFGFVPKPVIRRHVHHDVPKGSELLPNLQWPQGAAHFAPHNAANGQVATGGSQGEGPKRVLALAQHGNIEAAIGENWTCGHSSPGAQWGA